MRAWHSRVATGVVILGVVAWLPVRAADITWTGGGDDRKWSTGANWSSTTDWPLNPSIHRLIFGATDSGATPKILANIPNWNGSIPTNAWRVGGLRITGAPHALDLDGKTLRISTEGGAGGDLYMLASAAGDTFTGFNGTVVVERDVALNRGALDLTDATLHGALRDLKVAWESDGRTAYVDLRGTTIGGGVLDVRDLFVGARKTNKGYLRMDATTAIDMFRVRRDAIIGRNQSGEGYIGWQDPDRGNLYFLPPGLNLVFGERDEGEAGRGIIRIGLSDAGGGGNVIMGRLAVHAGGDFDGWMNRLQVASATQARSATGVLDLRGLDTFTLDANDLYIGYPSSLAACFGDVWFPAGTARVDRVYMGDDTMNSRATLDLSGTLLKIDNQLDMRDTTGAQATRITIRVQGHSCGLDFAPDATRELTGPATIRIVFEDAPEPGQDHYWGLRAAGDHVAELGAMTASGAITVTFDFEGSEAYRDAVYFEDGYTHVAAIDADDSIPPAVLARDRILEADTATVRMDANDMLASLYNPDNLTETGRTIAHPAVNGGTPAAYLDFPTASLPATYSNVLLTVTYEGDISAEDSAHVTFLALQEGSPAALTWTGEASDFVHLDRREWFWGANWSAWQPPLNPTAATLTFADDNTGGEPKLLAPITDWDGAIATNVWRIGSLRIGNTTGQHTLDLGGQTLEIAGNLQAERLVATGALNMTLTNGAVTVGGNLTLTDGQVSFIDAWVAVANDILTYRSSQLRFAGATLQGTLRDLRISSSAEQQNGNLDLRGGAVDGGVLDMRDLFLGAVKNTQGYLYLDETTAITTLRARRNVIMGNSQSSTGQIGRQVPERGNLFFLPPGLNLVFGNRDLGESGRGSIRIAMVNTGGSSGSTGRLAVESGGSFDGWLSLLDVASADAGYGGTGRLDLGGLDAFTLDATELKIGTTSGANTGVPNGIVWLPPGTARVDRVYMGHATLNNRATLDLTGTALVVDELLDLRDTAGANPTELIVRAQGSSCGPDLAASATLNIQGPARIMLRFEAAPEPGPAHYWGLRWEGNQAAVLGGLEQSGVLQLSMHFAESNDFRTAIYFDNGYTYAGVIDAAAAVAAEVTARDRTVEVLENLFTRIDANDVFLALNNPDELVETARTIKHPDVNGGAEAAYLDFPTGSLPASYDDVILTIHFEDDITAQDTAKVEFVPAAMGTDGNLTWTGLASDFVHLDRREWLWGHNWTGLQPPLNPMSGTLTFGDDDASGSAPIRLYPVADWDGTTLTNRWRIGALRAGNTLGAHTLDLGDDMTLEVTGNVRVERLFPTGAAVLTITNGALAVGGDVNTVNATLTLRNVGLTLSPTSTFNVAPGSTTIITNAATVAGPFRDLLVGAITGGTGILDMRGGAFTDGVLDVRDLRVAGHSGGGSYGEFRLNADTLDTIRVARHFWMNSTDGAANNQRGWARIGAPDPARGNRWYLPDGVNLVIGTPSSRGTLQLNWNTSGWLSTGISLLGTTGGGTFEAWLSSLVVGKSNGTGGRGMVDLRQAGSFLMDATTVRIGAMDPNYDYVCQGEVFLPPGEATFGTLVMGRSGSSSSFGRLRLNDTRVEVTGSATLNAAAEITINLSGSRVGGLELPGWPTVADGAEVTIVFEAVPTHNGLHYGLKIAGDVAAALAEAEWLTVDDAALSQPAQVFLFQGATYVGIPPPRGTLLLMR